MKDIYNDDYTSVAQYRPRYTEEESSDDAYTKDNSIRKYEWRKRRVMIVILVIVLTTLVGMITRVYLFFSDMGRSSSSGSGQYAKSGHISTNSTQSTLSSGWGLLGKKKVNKPGKKAPQDSYGFFNAISDVHWKKIKQDTMEDINLQDEIMGRTSYLLTESGANINSDNWFIENWKVNFKCPTKLYIGGKWICDPARIISIADEEAQQNKPPPRLKKKVASQKECIIYISGGNEIDFANQFLEFSKARMTELHNDISGEDENGLLACELHIFAPHGQEMQEHARDGIFIHNWGFRPSNKASMGVGAASFKTIQQSITELGHAGRISMLILDCEGCEWDIYSDILSLDESIQQVQMQMHGTPFMANELFLHMQEAGYVIYHREAAGYGEVYDYAWIQLAPTFFNWKG